MASSKKLPCQTYKFFLPVTSSLNEYAREVTIPFVWQFKDELKELWTLVDEAGNSHVVTFNMSLAYPRLTKGWYELREFYNLEGTFTFWLHLVDECLFHIHIYNIDAKEIYIPGAPLDIFDDDTKAILMEVLPVEVLPPDPFDDIPIPLDVFDCIFTCTLSASQASSDRPLHLPPAASAYFRSCRTKHWKLIGPAEIEVHCRILRPRNITMAKIHCGWKDLCERNGLSPSDELIFRITNPHDRIIYVDFLMNHRTCEVL